LTTGITTKPIRLTTKQAPKTVQRRSASARKALAESQANVLTESLQNENTDQAENELTTSITRLATMDAVMVIGNSHDTDTISY
jgi:hypothetical protein